MPKFTTDSKFLSNNDLSDVDDTVVTIKGVSREAVGQGAQAKDKWILYFHELKKGLGLNKTNGEIIISVLGTSEMNDWIGKQIALYVKPDVEFQGKTVPAIRVRTKAPGSTLKVDESMNIDAWQQDIEAAESVAEVFALKRRLTYAPFSDEDIAMCKVIADQRMTELKKASAA